MENCMESSNSLESNPTIRRAIAAKFCMLDLDLLDSTMKDNLLDRLGEDLSVDLGFMDFQMTRGDSQQMEHQMTWAKSPTFIQIWKRPWLAPSTMESW